MAGLETYILGAAFWMTVVLGSLALALTLSGLFSVLSYLVEQRQREIGVRMALGATTRNVSRLVLAQSFGPVVVGLAAGAALAGGLATLLLNTPYAPLINSVDVLDPAAYAGSLLCVIAACAAAASIPAARAARIDPIATLRQD
jgi:ABC-type antimicrobial peptide transport system permease subunit